MGGWIGQARALTYRDEAIGAAPPSIPFVRSVGGDRKGGCRKTIRV
jgi:hypothetical protein